MIVIALAIFSLFSYLTFIYMPGRMFSNILTLLSIIGIIISSFFIVINWKYHYGMKQETTITSKLIYPTSASKQMKTLVYQPIGSQNKHQIYIYRTKLDSDKIVHTQATIMTKNKIVISDNKPYLEIRNTRWIYNSGLSNFWFGITGQNKTLVKRINTFHINKDWIVLSSVQANKIKKKMIKNKDLKENSKSMLSSVQANKIKKKMIKKQGS